MGFAQAMEHLAEEIKSATTARGTSLSHLRQEVTNHQQTVRRQLHDIHQENRHNARELRGKLVGNRAHLASEEKSRQNAAQQETEQRRVVKSELRANTHSLLSRARLERQETIKALQDKIASGINDLYNTVSHIRSATKSMVGEITADLRGAHEAWVGVKKKQ